MMQGQKRVLQASVLLGVGGIGGFALANADEGTKRSMKFWRNVLPIFIQYRTIQFLNRDIKWMSDTVADGLYNELNDRYAETVKDLTYELKGFYLKHAQFMSMQDDFVPPQYLKWMKDTQDHVPSEFNGTEAREYVAKLCKEELGLEFDDVFSSWDDEPLGVASIGQVHRAVLRSNGKKVAVKFQNPGIERKFRADIKTLKAFCKIARPQHVSAFNEIEKQFTGEFNYQREAESLEQAFTTTLPKWKDVIAIPQPYTFLSSKNMLVMEYLDGVKLVDGIRQQYGRLAALAGKSLEEVVLERNQAMKNGTFQYKSIEEAKVDAFRLRVALTAHDIVRYNIGIFAYNWLHPSSWWNGPVKYVWTEIPIDLGQTIELLSKFQASNIFQDGYFNGDAHPGNILLLKDGRIGLVDYGQMKHMTIEDRIKYAKMVIAIARDDKKEIVRIYFDEMKVKTKYRNEDIAYRVAVFGNDRFTPEILGDHNIATFLEHCEWTDPILTVADQFIFVARASIIIRGMGNAFGLKLRICEMWKEDAEKFLQSQNIVY